PREKKPGRANSSSQKPVLRPVLPNRSSDVSTISILGLRGIVWVKKPDFEPQHASRWPLARVLTATRPRENGTMLECLGRRRDWRMPIAFLDSSRVDGGGACLEIPRVGSWSWSESKKNGVRRLRSRAQYILRPQDTARTRSFLRGYARVSRGGVPASGVPQLWSCETGEAELDRGQSAVHQTVCLLCGATMPGVDAERRSQGTAPGLADGQEPGDAIHARTAPPRGNARTVGDWD